MNPRTTSRRLCALPRPLTRRRRKFQRNAKDQSGCSATGWVQLACARARARKEDSASRSISSEICLFLSLSPCNRGFNARVHPRACTSPPPAFSSAQNLHYSCLARVSAKRVTSTLFPPPRFTLASCCVAVLLLRNSASCLGAR